MPLPAWAQALGCRQYVGIWSRCAHSRRVDSSFISRIVSVPLSTVSRRVATQRKPWTAAICLNASSEPRAFPVDCLIILTRLFWPHPCIGARYE